MYAVGLDIGTTSICGILMNSADGKIIKVLNRANTSFIKSENAWEKIQNPEEILSSVLEILEELTDGEKIGAIGISNQMHGILYTDAEGNSVSPLYIWQDGRGNLEYKDGITYARELSSFSGYGLVTDFYNRANGLVPESAASCCTIGDYTAMKLCSVKKPLMHITNAASFGCFDVKENKFTIDNGMLPEVTADFKCVGERDGVPVCVSIGDNQASFMGSVSGGFPLVNVGTGSQISYLSDEAVTGENIEARPYDGKKYLIAGSSLCGGRAFAILERFFASVAELATGEKPESLYKQIDKMLESKTETEMLADSRFCGTRSNPDLRASFTNISEDNFTAGDMTVALLNAIADELYSMYGGGECGSLVCSGNGIRKNPALRRIVSNIFSAEIKIPYYNEEASYGAALAALTAVGEFASLEDAQKLIIYKD